jgi:hypothetical protein
LNTRKKLREVEQRLKREAKLAKRQRRRQERPGETVSPARQLDSRSKDESTKTISSE